jgi:hypothetical protein
MKLLWRFRLCYEAALTGVWAGARIARLVREWWFSN